MKFFLSFVLMVFGTVMVSATEDVSEAGVVGSVLNAAAAIMSNNEPPWSSDELPCNEAHVVGIQCTQVESDGNTYVTRAFASDMRAGHKLAHLLPSILRGVKNQYDKEKVLDSLHESVKSGNIDANAKDKNGNTPLHYAAYKGSLQSLRFFIESGADVNVLNADLRTPLDVARNGETSSVLRENGANSGDYVLSVTEPAVIRQMFQELKLSYEVQGDLMNVLQESLLGVFEKLLLKIEEQVDTEEVNEQVGAEEQGETEVVE